MGDRCDIEDFQGRVRRCFEKHHAGVVSQHIRKPVDFVGSKKRSRDADLREIVAQQLESATVDIADADDLLARPRVSQERGSFCGHAGRKRQRVFAAF